LCAGYYTGGSAKAGCLIIHADVSLFLADASMRQLHRRVCVYYMCAILVVKVVIVSAKVKQVIAVEPGIMTRNHS